MERILKQVVQQIVDERTKSDSEGRQNPENYAAT